MNSQTLEKSLVGIDPVIEDWHIKGNKVMCSAVEYKMLVRENLGKLFKLIKILLTECNRICHIIFKFLILHTTNMLHCIRDNKPPGLETVTSDQW